MFKALIRKFPKINLGESLFLQRPLGLQTRITLLVAMIVVTVLVVFSYLEFRLAEHSQWEILRERTVYLTREIDTKIYGYQDLWNRPFLEEEISKWMNARPFIQSIDIFLFQRNSYTVHVSSLEKKDLGLSYQNLQSLKRDFILSTLIDKDGHTYWKILAPLHMGRKIIGGIHVITSLEETETFLANKRARTILFTLISVAILVLILAFFFSRAINRPIQRLVQAMSEAEAGKLKAEVPIESRDELGHLAGHFNRMLARINQFNEELTQRVESATRELAQRNEELRLANDSLFKTQRQLVQAEKLSALGHMAATMAHEIGTPLNSISGYIQLILSEGSGSEILTKRLKIIESQLDRMAQIIHNLLHSTRQPEPQLQALDVNLLLEAMVNLTQPGISSRNIQLMLHLQPSLPPIAGDPTLLQQVFLNLLTNALDAMPQGGVLTILTAPLPHSGQNGNFVEVVMMDSGMGMPDEVKRRVLDPFFTTKDPGKGAGLGLTICHDIIQSHHGQMKIESQEGKGSTIRIQLPTFSVEVD